MTAVGLPPRRPIVLLSSLLLLELLHCSHAYQSGGLHNNDLVAFSSTLTVPGLVSTTVCHSKQKTTPPLPILYTNQPHCIEKWLSKEVVSSQSARPVLGLDVEVRMLSSIEYIASTAIRMGLDGNECSDQSR